MFDVVVVGAGSAGGALAARISEEEDRDVLLIEAGPDYPDFDSLPDELKYSYSAAVMGSEAIRKGERRGWLISERHDWRYSGFTSPSENAIPVPRGKVTGGSSAINGAVWQRGTTEDFDGWAAQGNDGWAFDDMLPVFRRMESDSGGLDEYHGRSGPVRIRRFPENEWLGPHAAFRESAIRAGHKPCEDANQPGSYGVGSLSFNNPGDVRQSTALAYLRPARSRANLTIAPDTAARRVIFDGRCAVGVEVTRPSGRVEAVEARNVVLCAGAVGSPQLLMLSGVGPGEELGRHGIPIVKPLAGVGRNLQDHPTVQLSWGLQPGHESGPTDPRVQMMLRSASPLAAGQSHDVWIVNVVVGDALAMYAGVDLAGSTGLLTLASADPAVMPVIDYRYYSDEADLERMRYAVRISFEVARTRPLVTMLDSLLSPPLAVAGQPAALDEWIKENTVSANHISSTCKMGPARDVHAVVDSRGHVHGLGHLWVADASIMPSITRAPTNLTSIAIGERVSDFIREDIAR